MIDINKILEEAPNKISEYSEKENACYGDMIIYHERYKKLRAKIYLETKTKEEKKAIKDIEYELDVNEELAVIKNKEISAEIDYRGWRTKKEKAKDYFMMACERGRNQRAELRGLNDTIGGEQ